MSMRDPGLDRHEWATEYASLEEDLRTDPRGALPPLADLVGRMLEERGAADGDELGAEFDAARELVERSERGEAGPGDVAAAVESLRTIYSTLLVERSTP